MSMVIAEHGARNMETVEIDPSLNAADVARALRLSGLALVPNQPRGFKIVRSRHPIPTESAESAELPALLRRQAE